MTTIEERAKESFSNYTVENSEDIRCARIGYIKGANEQHDIDVSKACEWLENNACFKKVGDKWIFNTTEFRKAMEE